MPAVEEEHYSDDVFTGWGISDDSFVRAVRKSSRADKAKRAAGLPVSDDDSDKYSENPPVFDVGPMPGTETNLKSSLKSSAPVATAAPIARDEGSIEVGRGARLDSLSFRGRMASDSSAKKENDERDQLQRERAERRERFEREKADLRASASAAANTATATASRPATKGRTFVVPTEYRDEATLFQDLGLKKPSAYKSLATAPAATTAATTGPAATKTPTKGPPRIPAVIADVTDVESLMASESDFRRHPRKAKPATHKKIVSVPMDPDDSAVLVAMRSFHNKVTKLETEKTELAKKLKRREAELADYISELEQATTAYETLEKKNARYKTLIRQLAEQLGKKRRELDAALADAAEATAAADTSNAAAEKAAVEKAIAQKVAEKANAEKAVAEEAAKKAAEKAAQAEAVPIASQVPPPVQPQATLAPTAQPVAQPAPAPAPQVHVQPQPLGAQQTQFAQPQVQQFQSQPAQSVQYQPAPAQYPTVQPQFQPAQQFQPVQPQFQPTTTTQTFSPKPSNHTQYQAQAPAQTYSQPNYYATNMGVSIDEDIRRAQQTLTNLQLQKDAQQQAGRIVPEVAELWDQINALMSELLAHIDQDRRHPSQSRANPDPYSAKLERLENLLNQVVSEVRNPMRSAPNSAYAAGSTRPASSPYRYSGRFQPEPVYPDSYRESYTMKERLAPRVPESCPPCYPERISPEGLDSTVRFIKNYLQRDVVENKGAIHALKSFAIDQLGPETAGLIFEDPNSGRDWV